MEMLIDISSFSIFRVVYSSTQPYYSMKKILTLAALLISLQAFCQGQFQKESAGSLAFVSGQVTQLAQAIPADKYAWSPEPGVRSVAQVCAHIISANYFFAS